MIRVVFMGSASFACPSLEVLLQEEAFELVAVATQPDRPAGRGRKLRPTPIKELCAKLGREVIQPDSVNDESFLSELRTLSPEVIAVVAFGQKLGNEFLRLPRLGCVNLHGSLLPALRGAAPIQWALINGLSETGVTTIMMAEKIDAGSILLQRATPIDDDDDCGRLHDRLAEMGAGLLVETLLGLADGRITPQPQDTSLVTRAPKIDPADREVNWREEARAVFNRIRAFCPLPGARSRLDGRMVKLLGVRLGESSGEMMEAGTILTIDEEGAVVACGQGSVIVSRMQMEGGRSSSPKALLAGRLIKEGSVLG